jgi:hypothetical protein
MMKRAQGMITGLLLVLGAAAAFGQDAYIREITGTVEVKGPGAAEWVRAEEGQRISRDTLISTGFKSTALIVVGNSTIQVRPVTRLSLEELQSAQGNEDVRFDLRAGRVRVDVKPPAEGEVNFTIRSPVATASVRGTSFDFDGLNLRVTEGLVRVSEGGGAGVYVGAGHSVVPNPESGRMEGGIETARAELSPVLTTAAATEAIPEPPVIVPQSGDFGFGFIWE